MVVTTMRMTAVVAMAENRVIGDGSGLIWHIPDDLKRVKMLTIGRPLIMGRKTWDSIGRPLPGRASIVMTRDAKWSADGAVSVPSIEAAIWAAFAAGGSYRIINICISHCWILYARSDGLPGIKS